MCSSAGSYVLALYLFTSLLDHNLLIKCWTWKFSTHLLKNNFYYSSVQNSNQIDNFSRYEGNYLFPSRNHIIFSVSHYFEVLHLHLDISFCLPNGTIVCKSLKQLLVILIWVNEPSYFKCANGKGYERWHKQQQLQCFFFDEILYTLHKVNLNC